MVVKSSIDEGVGWGVQFDTVLTRDTLQPCTRLLQHTVVVSF